MNTETFAAHPHPDHHAAPGADAKAKYGLTAGILAFTLFGTCDSTTIPLPRADSTTPTVNWVFQNKTKGTELASFEGSGGPIEVGVNDEVAVFCAAKDKDGGVRELKLSGTFAGDCKDGQNEHGQFWFKENILLFLPIQQEISEPQNNNVKTQLTLTKVVKPFDITCGKSPTNEDFHVHNGSLIFTARAENHHGGVKEEQLKLAVKQ